MSWDGRGRLLATLGGTMSGGNMSRPHNKSKTITAPIPLGTYRHFFDSPEAYNAAMEKADRYDKKGLPRRAHRIRLNIDGMKLGRNDDHRTTEES
jgi:hypothetical protein